MRVCGNPHPRAWVRTRTMANNNSGRSAPADRDASQLYYSYRIIKGGGGGGGGGGDRVRLCST